MKYEALSVQGCWLLAALTRCMRTMFMLIFDSKLGGMPHMTNEAAEECRRSFLFVPAVG